MFLPEPSSLSCYLYPPSLPLLTSHIGGDDHRTHLTEQRSRRAWWVASDDSILYVQCWNPTIIQSQREGWLCCCFFTSYRTRLPLSLSVCLTTAAPLFTDQTKTKNRLTFVYWRNFSVASVGGICSALRFKLHQKAMIIFRTGWLRYGMG